MRRRDGSEIDLIGRPIDRLPEPSPGIAIRKVDDMGKKATRNGLYKLNGFQFVMEKGQILPDGAEVLGPDGEAAEADVVEERAKPKAPENRKKPAPENR